MAEQSLSHVSKAEAAAATGADNVLNDVPTNYGEIPCNKNNDHKNECTGSGLRMADGPQTELHKYQQQPMKWNGNGITIGVRGLTNQTCMSTGHKSAGDPNCSGEHQ